MKYLAGLGVCLINVISMPIFMVLLVVFVTLDFMIKTITCFIPCRVMYQLADSWNQRVYGILLSITCLASICYGIESNEEENEEN